MNSSKGFTFLEILIAIAIMGMGLTLMVSIFKHNSEMGKEGQDYFVASLLGQKKMEEIIQRGYEDILNSGNKSFGKPVAFQEDGEVVSPGYGWTHEIVLQENDLLKLKVRVLWPEPDNTHHVDFSTFLANRE